MERAAALVLTATAFQGDTRTDHFDDVDAGEEIVDETMRYAAGPGGKNRPARPDAGRDLALRRSNGL